MVEPWLRSVAESPPASASNILATAGSTLKERWHTITSSLDQEQKASVFGLHTTGYVFSFIDHTPLRTSFSSRTNFAAKRYQRQGISWVPLTQTPPPSVLAEIDDSDGGLMRLARHVATECDRNPSTAMHIDGELCVVRFAPHGVIDCGPLGRIRPGNLGRAS